MMSILRQIRTAGLVLAISVSAALTARAQFPNISPTQMQKIQAVLQEVMMMRSAPIQKELKVTEVQKDLINNLVNDMQQELQGIMTEMMGSMTPDSSPADMEQQMMGVVRQLESKGRQLQGKMEQVLDDKQRARWKEISLQQRGAAALLDEEIMDKLKLTDSQRKSMEDISTEVMKKQQKMAEEMMGSMQGGAPNMNSMREQATSLQDELNYRLLTVLTEAQKKDFERMKGQKFYAAGPPRPFQ